MMPMEGFTRHRQRRGASKRQTGGGCSASFEEEVNNRRWATLDSALHDRVFRRLTRMLGPTTGEEQLAQGVSDRFCCCQMRSLIRTLLRLQDPLSSYLAVTMRRSRRHLSWPVEL